MDKWVTITDEQSCRSSIFITVAGSPKLDAYKIDFGWGCPKKTEVIHIDLSSTISLSDCKDDQGGIEIGLQQNIRNHESRSQLLMDILAIWYLSPSSSLNPQGLAQKREAEAKMQELEIEKEKPFARTRLLDEEMEVGDKVIYAEGSFCIMDR
ncbi:hypothetical protein ACFE04_016287 [Oxalis oulophora]